MRTPGFITIIAVLSCMTACMSMDADMESSDRTATLRGIVLDEADNPLNHIRICLEWDSPESPMSVYTSPKGMFSAEIGIAGQDFPITVSVEISDVDGEENGGRFLTMTDKIFILEESDPADEDKDIVTYRLSRANVSESNPQSL